MGSQATTVPAGRDAARLGNTQITLPQTPAARLLQTRKDVQAARTLLWNASSLPRVSRCGRIPLTSAVSINSPGAKGRAGFGGLETCGSVHACPSCAQKVSGHRADEIARAITEWQGRGHSVVFLTLTNRHYQRHKLRQLWDATTTSWARVTSGRAWTHDKDRHGIKGFIRVVEVTHGRHGWHVHIHALLFLDGKRTTHHAQAIGSALFTRWRDALILQGFPAPSFQHGQDARLVTPDNPMALGSYFAKSVYTYKNSLGSAKAGMEAAGAVFSKKARRGNRTPWQVLRDYVETRNASDLKLWHEWEQGSQGRRQITWTNGLRDDLLTTPVLTDEQIAELKDTGTPLALIDRDDWKQITRTRPHLLPYFLHWAEQDPSGALLLRELTRHNVPHQPVPAFVVDPWMNSCIWT